MKNLNNKSYKNSPKEGQRVVYTCKSCGWKTSVLASWGDLKPKRCMGRKCGTHFLKNPDKLLVEKPEKKVEKCEECSEECSEDCSEDCESKKKSKKNKKK